MKSNGYGRVTVLDGTLPTYCMFLLRRFEPQITAIQIANMKANPTITIFMATLRSRRACQRQAHGSSIVFLACRNRVVQRERAIRLLMAPAANRKPSCQNNHALTTPGGRLRVPAVNRRRSFAPRMTQTVKDVKGT
jgi:hypothetical protein